MAIDTFGQQQSSGSPLMAYAERNPNANANATTTSRPSSSSGPPPNSGRSNGVKSVTPPQMYTTDATMAIEEYTDLGTTTNNSSPTKLPNTERSNAEAAYHNNSKQQNAMIRKKGLPWVLAAQVFLIFLLLIIIGYLLYRVYGEEEEEGDKQLNGLFFKTAPKMKPFQSSSANPLFPAAGPSKAEQQIVQSAATETENWPPLLNSRTLEAQFTKAAVVSENGICSELGRNVLLKGGNAVDAAIAVAACIGALNGHSAGLGGGFLMTYYQRFYGKCVSIDARETAPSRTHKDIFASNSEDATIGYKSVAVPGEVHGYWTAFKRFGSGKIAWMDLLMPTVGLLNDGYPASRQMELSLKVFSETILNGTHPGMRTQFVNPTTGELYKEGELIRNPVLADTYKRLATSHDPVQLFYAANGEFARTIVDEFARNGGYINRKDLHNYRSFVDEQPLLNTEADPKLVFCGPKPSSGFAVAQLIVAIMMKFYPHNSDSSMPWNSVEYWHRLVEAQKYAFALRTKLGDAHFLKEAEALAENMTSKAFVEEIVRKIGPKSFNYTDYGFVNIVDIEAFIDDGGTSQVVVVDADGNAVSMTHSINNIFGSVVRSPQLGIIWNNHMDDFSLPRQNNSFGFAPSRANFIEPGKRPMSSMSPMIVYDRESRKVKIAIGASGGPKIPSAVAQVLGQVLSFNHSLKQAIDTPRLHNQFTPFDTHYEPGFPKPFIDQLEAKFGHQHIASMNFPIANVHAVLRTEQGHLIASNDHRRQVLSYPVGY